MVSFSRFFNGLQINVASAISNPRRVAGEAETNVHNIAPTPHTAMKRRERNARSFLCILRWLVQSLFNQHI